jgi:hypothetical protein
VARIGHPAEESTDLKAVVGVKVTCTAKDDDGKDLSIPVTVLKADASSVTWTFERV